MYEVEPVEALVARRHHGPDPEQRGALGRPVPRRPGPVVGAGHHDERGACRSIPLRSLEDGGHLAGGVMQRPAALAAIGQPVAQAGIGERPPHHHLVVAAPGPEDAEVGGGHSPAGEVLPGRTVGRHSARRRYVVGGRPVTEEQQAAGTLYVVQRLRLRRDRFGEGRSLHVGGDRVPVVERPGLADQRPPLIVTDEDLVAAGVEQGGVERTLGQFGDLGVVGPQIREQHTGAVGVGRHGLRREVDVDGASQGVGHHQRGRGEVGEAALGVDATLEVAVAREHGS